MHLDSRTPAGDADISSVERKIGSRLPEDYRTWLAMTDGADIESLPMPTIGGTALLDEFYSCRDLATLYQESFGESVPERYLPVGGTGGGAVCLRIKDGDVGAVYWANYDLANNILADGQSSENIMMRIADNWNQFLANW